MNEPFSLVLCLPDGTDLFDPDPAATSRRDLRLTAAWDDQTRGVVGFSNGGWKAIALAARHPELPRLVLVSLPFPDHMPTDFDPAAVHAKTLLVYGTNDPVTGNRHATEWQRLLPNARVEMNPDGGHDLLVPAWTRITSFIAPRRSAR